tara:strand:- start:5711 stop:7339 length:1629 start_codon:yes stop_codon:yes gene_type:complete
MDFSRVLNQSFQENAPKQSDATKQLLDQGMNFQKTMAGERGIMAAIESAHLRPKIAAFIKGKLNNVSSDDVLNSARNIGTRLTGRPATRGEIAGPRAPPVVTENKVLARGPSETGLVQEGGFQSLAPGRGVAERFGSEPTASIAGSRLTRGLDASNNPLNPRNVANVGQSERVPELDTPTNLPGLRGPAAVSREALASAAEERIPATTSEQIASLSSKVASKFSPNVLPDIQEPVARTGALAGDLGSKRPVFRTAKDTSDNIGPAPQPSADDEALGASQVEAQAQRVAAQGEAQLRAVPKPTPESSQAGTGTPAPEDFPSPPSNIPPPARAAAPEPDIPPPARGETDEQLAERLARVQEVGTGEEEASSVLSGLGSAFGRVVGVAGTLGEGAGLVSAFASKGLTGQQRLGQVSQTLAPRAVGKAGSIVQDQFGLPKPPAGAGAGAEAGAGAGADEEKIGQEAADRALAEKLAAQGGKEAAVATEEAAVPGLGDVLALGTALFGAIRGGVEAGKAKKEAEDYVAPAAPRVAMDNAVSFDSSFR